MSELFETAARYRGGYMFRSDLLDLGLRDKHIAQAVRAGELERLRSGTYAPRGACPLSIEGRHALVARSVVDKLGTSVALSHHSAALLHTGAAWGMDLSTVHVTRLNGRGGRTESGITFHVGTVVADEDLCMLDGRQSVVADRAVIESNSLTNVEGGMVTTSFALRGECCTRAELEDRMRACERWPGMLHVRLAVAKSEPRCESVGEVRSLYLFGAHRVPRPTVQLSIATDDGTEVARCDFGWESNRHVGEFDGAVKYGRLNKYEGTDLGRAIVDEKRREDRIRSLDYGMTRWMWDDLEHHPENLAHRVLTDLERSRRLYRRNATVIP
jgi:hypothetical protein